MQYKVTFKFLCDRVLYERQHNTVYLKYPQKIDFSHDGNVWNYILWFTDISQILTCFSRMDSNVARNSVLNFFLYKSESLLCSQKATMMHGGSFCFAHCIFSETVDVKCPYSYKNTNRLRSEKRLTCQNQEKDFSNFVAFSENLDFSFHATLLCLSVVITYYI